MPEHRKQKIGTALMKETLEYAKDMNIPVMTLFVIQDNKAAVNLYTKHNFDNIDSGVQFEYEKCFRITHASYVLKSQRDIKIEVHKIDSSLKNSIDRQDTIYYFVHEKQIGGYCNFDLGFPGCNHFSICDK